MSLAAVAPSRFLAPTLRAAARPREAFGSGLESSIDILARAMRGRAGTARRRKAVAAMAGLVGALTLARAVGDPALSDEILAAVHSELLAAADR